MDRYGHETDMYLPCPSHRILMNLFMSIDFLNRRTRSWHALGNPYCLVLPHEEVEFHVPLELAESAAACIDVFLHRRADYMLSLRYTKSSVCTYVSFVFSQYIIGQVGSFKQSILDLSRHMPIGTWVHKGKGQYVTSSMLSKETGYPPNLRMSRPNVRTPCI